MAAALAVAASAAAAPRARPSRPGPTLQNFTLVGHAGLGGDIDFADLWAYGDFAYVGTSCGPNGGGAGGVRVVSLANPRRPKVVSRLPNAQFTRAQDVVVRGVRTPAFTGALAVVGVQLCLENGRREDVRTGLLFFDVTRPAQPRLLSEWTLPAGSVGCHEVDLVQRRDGRVLAGCARQVSDQVDSAQNELPGGVQLVDATDPRRPVAIAAWDLPLKPAEGVGCMSLKFAHSIRFADAGQSAYVSYWDAGTVHLDLTNPGAPVVVSDIVVTPRDEDGDNHSVTTANRGRWLVVNLEDFSPAECGARFGGWGDAYVYDNTDPANPRYLGRFATRDARIGRGGGIYTIHNTEVALDRQMFSSWYSDGIVWWTMSSRGVAHDRGRFVPTAGGLLRAPMVWGVFVDSRHDLILASDIGSGLWLVRPKGLRRF